MLYNLVAMHRDERQSTAHDCGKNQHMDPVDVWADCVDADTPEEAAEIGRRHLAEDVAECVRCSCKQRRKPGSPKWWESVQIIATVKNL